MTVAASITHPYPIIPAPSGPDTFRLYVASCINPTEAIRYLHGKKDNERITANERLQTIVTFLEEREAYYHFEWDKIPPAKDKQAETSSFGNCYDVFLVTSTAEAALLKLHFDRVTEDYSRVFILTFKVTIDNSDAETDVDSITP